MVWLMPFLPYLAIAVTAIAGYLIIKRWSNHMVLLFSGLLMIFIAFAFGNHISFKGFKATGFELFDLFALLDFLGTKQAAGTGFMIMCSGGFAKYMEKIGAANALVQVTSRPLSCLRHPYLVLVIGYLLSQTIVLAITSAAGLAMLLVVVLLPVLVGAGVSVPAAAAVIATSAGVNIGPVCGNSIFAARTANMDPVTFFVMHQLPAGVPAVLIIAMTHCIVQRYYDAKKIDIYDSPMYSLDAQSNTSTDAQSAPALYALLPVLPIVLLITFSDLTASPIKLNTASALFLSWIFGVCVELVRHRNPCKAFDDAIVFFKSMGTMFGTIVSLIICAEMFASGLKLTGLIDLVVDAGKNAHMGLAPMTVMMCAIIGSVATLTGSAVGPFSSLASIAPDIVAGLGVGSVASITMPMHVSATLFRAMSPVAGVVLVVAGTTGLSPFSIVRRTCIPMLAGFIVVLAVNYLLFQ